LLELEHDAGNDIGWIMAEAYRHYPRGLHFHLLIQGVSHVSRKKWWRILAGRFGRSQIQPYDGWLDGIGYAGENGLAEGGDLHFGGRLWDPAKARFRRPHQARKRAGRGADEEKGLSWPCYPPPVTAHGPFRIFVDGGGKRPDGTGSGYAFFNQTTGEKRVRWVDGLTNNEAEYRAIIYALCNIPRRERAEILSDSELVVNQFNGKWAINDPKLQRLLNRCLEVVEMHRLRVTLKWIPREQNLADRLLRRRAK